MADEYLEILKSSERGSQMHMRMCHNFKNIVIVKEKLWWQDKPVAQKENSFIIPAKYIEPINEYTKKNYLFQLKIFPKNLSDKKSLFVPPILWLYLLVVYIDHLICCCSLCSNGWTLCFLL